MARRPLGSDGADLGRLGGGRGGHCGAERAERSDTNQSNDGDHDDVLDHVRAALVLDESPNLLHCPYLFASCALFPVARNPAGGMAELQSHGNGDRIAAWERS